ncbi:hypothetical protein ACFCX0_43915 [Streptomyces sp. NPDC056352]|uniref:hypothetical protein n=1 Tax=Streptomyces sp. NPDC056352 TaxID=3345791 RepID=UPI0035DACE09
MIRLHFTDADLRRVTVAQAPDALLETALSVRRLRGGTATGGPTRPALSQWHKAMQETRPRPGVLLDLVPRNGFLPDFLQQPTARDLATALDLVTATSAEQLALDLGLADTPGWNGSLEQPSRRVPSCSRCSASSFARVSAVAVPTSSTPVQVIPVNA